MRLGLLGAAADPQAVVERLVMRDLYEEVARSEGVAVPDDDMSPVVVGLDGARFEPESPAWEMVRR